MSTLEDKAWQFVRDQYRETNIPRHEMVEVFNMAWEDYAAILQDQEKQQNAQAQKLLEDAGVRTLRPARGDSPPDPFATVLRDPFDTGPDVEKRVSRTVV